MIVYSNAAMTDPLTGLFNRRAFLEARASPDRRNRRARSESVSVLMFDLDHFKSINDRFGHAVGDEALRVFARVVACEHARTATSSAGLAARNSWPSCRAEEPQAASRERIRTGFEAAGAISRVARSARPSVSAPPRRLRRWTIRGLLARADAALYRAKHERPQPLCAATQRRAAKPARPADCRCAPRPAFSNVIAMREAGAARQK